jgi:nucleolar protein 12
VRIVRDKDTQLGKGFAYVQFIVSLDFMRTSGRDSWFAVQDTACVDEVVNMEESKLKFAKRKLRVQRCKTLPGGAKVPSTVSRPTKLATPIALPTTVTQRLKGVKALLSSAMPSAPVSMPKGDPSLGARLASLSKEERKKAKAADADRVARRTAKKKAKMAMVKAAAKGAKGVGEEKVRVRKRAGGVKGVGNARKEVKKKVGAKRRLGTS